MSQPSQEPTGTDEPGADSIPARGGADALVGTHSRGRRVRDVDAGGASLAGINLDGLRGDGIRGSGADFSAGSLRGAQLVGCDFRGANLSGTDLSGATLRICNLDGA